MKTALVTLTALLLAAAAADKRQARCKPVPYEGSCKQGYRNEDGAVCMNKFEVWEREDINAHSLIWSTSTVLTGKDRPHWPRATDKAAFYAGYTDTVKFYWCKWEDDAELEDTEREDTAWMNMLCEDKGEISNGKYWYNYYFYSMYSQDNPEQDVYRSYARNDRYQASNGWKEATDEDFFMVQYNVSTRLYWCIKREWIAPKQERIRARCEYRPCGQPCQDNAYKSNGTYRCLQGCWVPQDSDWETFDYRKAVMGPYPPQKGEPKTFKEATEFETMFVKFNSSTWVYWCDTTPQPACADEAPLVYGDNEIMNVECKRVDKQLGWYRYRDHYYQIEDVRQRETHETHLYRNETAFVPGRFAVFNDDTFYMMKYNLTTVLYRCSLVPETPLCTTTTSAAPTTSAALSTASETHDTTTTTVDDYYTSTGSDNETAAGGNETAEEEEGTLSQRLTGDESSRGKSPRKPTCSTTIIYAVLLGLAWILMAALIWDLQCRACKVPCRDDKKPVSNEAAVPLRGDSGIYTATTENM